MFRPVAKLLNGELPRRLGHLRAQSPVRLQRTDYRLRVGADSLRLMRKPPASTRPATNSLANSWRETDLSEREAQRIIDRIDGILAQLPDAIKQAHERIIGERVVPNESKTLSLYQPHAQVYVRGKSGADAEFGLQMLLSESAEGLIVDCHLLKDITSDSTLLMPAIERMRQRFGTLVAGTVVTDRGFSSAANDAALEKATITNMTLPRNPEAMHKLLQDPMVRRLQRRRAQTEARIGIFKANFLGDHLPTKDWPAQERFVAWATLAHNLWVLARLDQVAKPLAQVG